ncbi:lysophospholipid transporter LplT [Orrella sp. JC864]|uniref:lysophospholipid transporter LplT n=1 Tax=Orrella sp. JC864 TaxID=3120298 RepID=UPI00300B7787
MKRGFYLVMAAQALSSLADNALFIAAVALIQELQGPDWMTPAMKWCFALSYVLLAAFVGAFADSYPKGRVMFATNALKVAGCLLMFAYAGFGLSATGQTYLVCAAYAIVGVGAAAYSPAKYGIVTEMLPPAMLVKGNSWIEGLTVISIILGTVLGGALISPQVSAWLLSHPWINSLVGTPAEAAILVIAFVYLAAAACNLLIPHTHITYPPQQKHPVKLMLTFAGYVRILWRDKLGQISLAVTTLFWGAGATLQLIVIEWGRAHLGYRLDQASILMGVAAVGTVIGSILAGRIPLRRALCVLPMGALMGAVVMLMPFVHSTWSVYLLLLATGGLAGYFVVPMNALLQHRGHVLLSAGHSIAVQNFNEQLNILLMVACYTLMLWLDLHINVIIVIFGLLVSCLMLLVMRWSRRNLQADPTLHEQIGQEGHGKAL